MTSPTGPQQKPFGPLRSYGRVKSRPIKARQEGLLQTLLPTLELPEGPLDPAGLRGGRDELWLEIGFGGGEHMAAQAALHPESVIVGVEPFLNGVASAVRHVEEGALKNVRIHHGDARDVMARLPDGSLARVYILFPDPWPKSRHHKRRILQTETVVELARLLKPGGRVRFATDWAAYADWALERMVASPDFDWPAERATDWTTPPADHITTRYETKKLGDCAPVFFDFIRT